MSNLGMPQPLLYQSSSEKAEVDLKNQRESTLRALNVQYPSITSQH